ncbi:hypothetical protein [Reyranella sp.]|uniref:hypothetical protein n=1 Tax=Reyranella sp. TaxID=1929291 RepID=UPI004036020E
MLDTYAWLFFLVGQYLRSATRDIQRWRDDHPDELFISDAESAHEISIQHLEFAKAICRKLPLGTLPKEIDAAISHHAHGGALADRLEYTLGNIGQRFSNELRSHQFKYVSPELAGYYGQKEPFGPHVAKRFPDASEDLENAGNCLALEQSTASVFHLMRAMEVAVRVLATRLGITIHPKDSWGLIVGRMDPKIRAMPDNTAAKKRKKDAWSGVASNLHHVGQAWRNSTMHPKKTYTQSEAREVYEAVRAFMTNLASLR